VSLKTQLLLHPGARSSVLGVEAHEEHGVEGVDNGVADAAAGAEVGAAVGDGVILIVAEGVLL
jgi:UPF0716 family protein affecting phage T7 exclusion